MRNSAQIVKPSGIRTVIHAATRSAREWEPTGRRRAVRSSAILLDRSADKCTRSCAGRSADERTAPATRGETANQCARTSSSSSALPRRCITRSERKRSE
jgi:hypothetical protein